MVTKLDILNMALTVLGQKTITDLNDPSDRAVKIQVFYNQALHETLRAYTWSFATSVMKLQKVEGFESELEDLPFVYSYPDNVLRIQQLFYKGQPRNRQCLSENRYKIIIDENLNKLILANIEDAYVLATINVSNNTDLFDDVFVKALSFQLAYQSAQAICGDSNKMKECLSLFLQTIDSANAIDNNEQSINEDFISSYEQARQ